MSNEMLSWETHLTGQQRVKAIVSLLQLSDSKRKSLLRKVATKARKDSNAHRRAQKTPDGTPWEPRKKGRGKMMRKLARYLKATANSQQAMLVFNNTMVAKLAYAHHHGIGDQFDLQTGEVKRDSNRALEQKTAGARAAHGVSRQTTQPASKTQAKRLVDSGEFRIGKRRVRGGKRRNGGKGRIPSMRWIRNNLTRGQAGSIIRTLRLNKGTKTNWFVPRPRRPWLGLSWQETQEMADFIMDEMAAQLN